MLIYRLKLIICFCLLGLLPRHLLPSTFAVLTWAVTFGIQPSRISPLYQVLGPPTAVLKLICTFPFSYWILQFNNYTEATVVVNRAGAQGVCFLSPPPKRKIDDNSKVTFMSNSLQIYFVLYWPLV